MPRTRWICFDRSPQQQVVTSSETAHDLNDSNRNGRRSFGSRPVRLPNQAVQPPTLGPAMTRDTLRTASVVLLTLAFTLLAGEAIQEMHYANAHPDA
jgi:hypothetical protein